MNRISFGQATWRQLERAYLESQPVRDKDGTVFHIQNLEITNSREYPKLPEDQFELTLEGVTVGDEKNQGLHRMMKILFPKGDDDATTDNLSVVESENQSA